MRSGEFMKFMTSKPRHINEINTARLSSDACLATLPRRCSSGAWRQLQQGAFRKLRQPKRRIFFSTLLMRIFAGQSTMSCSQKHCIQYNDMADMVYVGIRNTVITSNHVKRNMRLTLRVPELFLKCSAWHSTFKKGNEIWLKFLMFVSNHHKSST